MSKAKSQNAFLVTFSQKNIDVYNLITDKKENKSFVISDYFCEAVRFYEKYKNQVNGLDTLEINKLIDLRLKEFKEELLNNGLNLNKIDDEELSIDIENTKIDIDDLEED